MREARRVRKMFGGGMRQAGVLAAAGLIALRKGPGRLQEDHEKATRLGRALVHLPGVSLLSPVETNIVVVELARDSRHSEQGQSPALELVGRLEAIGILGIAIGPFRVRLVTHRDVDSSAFGAALGRLEVVGEKLRKDV
jgi:threonine aldolase